MGKTLADLQSNISISAQNAVTGDIEWCSGYTQFSTDIGEQAGWYLALQVTPDVEDATVTAAYNGTIRELDNNIFIIRLAEGEDSITFTANKEGYTEGRLTLDLSGLDKETITNYCYVTSLTNGVTVTPLQFGESKQLSGVVPYDATTSSNHFRLKYRTFIPIPAGSQISVSHFGTELGSSTFSTVTPQEGEPYSEATVDITITQDILDSQSPGLSTLIIPDTGEVLDRFYCSLGVENLTLWADPIPTMNITSAMQDVTITPSTYSSTKAASGEVEYNTTQNKNLLVVSTAFTNVPANKGYHKLAAYDSTNTLITESAVYTTANLPLVFSFEVKSADVGTGKSVRVVWLSGGTSQAVNTQTDNIVIGTDSLTLEAAPTPVQAPDFTGIEDGDLGYPLFEISPNYSTYYDFDPSNGFESATLTYTSSETQDGHTIYHYEATPDFQNDCYIKYLDPSLTWFSCRNVAGSGDYWLFTRTPSLNNATATSGVYEYGNQLSTVMSSSGFPCNAFYCIQNAESSTLGDYHYTKFQNQGGGGAFTYVDMSDTSILIFATKGDSTSIPSTPIEFKLYNSTGSDYILISINMSNITASQYS